MPVTTTYPGVYIEELPSSVRTIVAVSTSVTAFVGTARHGPAQTPVTLSSFADFERRFGSLTSDNVLGHAVQQFFLNGGAIAIVVRVVGQHAATASVSIDGPNGPALEVTATEPGAFGNGLQVVVDYETADPEKAFNLRVSDATTSVNETFRNLTISPTDARYAPHVVNSGSRFITVSVPEGAGLPLASGTVSEPITLPTDLQRTYNVVIGDEPPREITLYDPAHDGAAPTSLTRLALLLENKLRRAGAGSSTLPRSAAFAGARVHAFGKRLRTISGVPGTKVLFDEHAASVPLNLQETANLPAYPLANGSAGDDVTGQDFIGSQVDKTGLNALRDVDDVNLLCLPEVADRADFDAILAEAAALCQDKRMLLLVDPPAAWTSLDEARAGMAEIDALRSSYAALYFPRIQATDPLTGQLLTLAPSGTVAGVMARTDGERGVWKAPAGTEARLVGARALTVPLTDPENGLLNPLGINCLRSFPIVGPVVWGARTLDGADVLASQWKYVPVRRTALMIEESLYRGTKWVVFEPNDERLWGQIRLNVGAFMQSLFRQGAFQGTSARDAYFVKCDKDTTTQDDINRGVVNILVGFAPLKPAEFVVVQIAQLAGQIEV
jgi:phage tail sheath protein FI